VSRQSETDKLRGRFRSLKSPILNLVRFQLNNVKIQYLQYNWISDLVVSGKISLTMSAGRSYDHMTDTLSIDDADAAFNVIVHEATHAIIDACYPGLKITKGTGEACAYLAETVFNIAWKDEAPYLDMNYLTKPVAQLARRVLAFNAGHPQPYVCDQGSVDEIIGILGVHMNVGRTDVMNGIKRL
jgi:hypothetical protein